MRLVNLAEAQAEVDYAIAQVTRIKSELEDYYVRVPIDGHLNGYYVSGCWCDRNSPTSICRSCGSVLTL